MISSLPHVSVVISTGDRPAHFERALASVTGQTFPDFEIIVIDTGRFATPDEGDHIRRLAVPGGLLGAARLLGLQSARGSLIANLDDLDVWQPDHLELLVGVLESDPQLVAVYGDARWVDAAGSEVAPPQSEPWPGVAQTPFLPSSGIVFRADAAWKVGGYDGNVDAFADWDLCIRMSDWWGLEQVRGVMSGQGLHPDRVEFGPRSEADRNRIAMVAMGRQIRVPRHQRNRQPERPQVGFDPETWTSVRRKLSVYSIFSGVHSYKAVNSGLLPALEREGVSISCVSPRQPVDDEFAHYRVGTPDDRQIGFFYEVANRPRAIGVHPLVQYTMAEQDFFPQIHVEEINRYVSLMYVPCRMNAETFKRAGVTVPIQVLHHGIDPARFPELERPDRETFTFGTFGQQNERKGIDVLLRAFRDEFNPREPVRLILNATMAGAWIDREESRIEVRSKFLSHPELLEYLRELDVMMLPSRGEGFGLCGLEAMSTGLPLIATNWSGPSEYLDPADSFPLDYELVETGGMMFGGQRLFGRWAEPSYEHMRHLMRRLYEDRSLGRAAGERASRRVQRDWTWTRVARQMVSNLDQLAAGVSPVSEF